MPVRFWPRAANLFVGANFIGCCQQPEPLNLMKNNSSFRSSFSFAVLGLALLGGLAALSGCLAVAAGAGAGVVAYVRGDLETTLANDYTPVVGATRNAVKDLEFVKVSDNKDAFRAVFVSRTALDKKVEISLTNAGKNLTNIKIRVGVFGDEQLSLAILEKIKAGL